MDKEVSQLEAMLANTTAIVAAVKPDQWEATTPCDAWNVRQVVQHTVGVMANFAGGAANTGAVGDPLDFDLGPDPAETCAAVAADCVRAWSDRGELESMVSLGDVEFPGAVALRINGLDAYVHGWDIATATGQEPDLDADLCAGLLAFAEEIVPPAPRDGDNFAAVVDTESGASTPDKLIAYLGRRP